MANARLCLLAAWKTSGMRTAGCRSSRTPRGTVLSTCPVIQLASSCGEPLISGWETVDDVTPFYRFWPRIGDVQTMQWRALYGLPAIVSLNRREAIIARNAPGFTTDTALSAKHG